MSDGPRIVFRSTEEAVYMPLVASMNAAGIGARAMDTAQGWLRWDIQVISPVEVWVPADQATEAHAYIEDWFAHEPGGAIARGWLSPEGNEDAGGTWRRFCWAMLILVVSMLFAGWIFAGGSPLNP
jgi:hypothetical protein